MSVTAEIPALSGIFNEEWCVFSFIYRPSLASQRRDSCVMSLKPKTKTKRALGGVGVACGAANFVIGLKTEEAWNGVRTSRGDETKAEQALKNILDKLVQSKDDFDKERKAFCDIFPSWADTRCTTIKKLKEIADTIDQLHKDCNIANVVGSSAEVAGGAMTIAGFALAPFTFGLSLGVSIAGGVTAAAGATTTVTTSIVESAKMKTQCEEAQKCLEKDQEKTKKIHEVLKRLSDAIENLDKIMHDPAFGGLDAVEVLENLSIACSATGGAASLSNAGISIGRGIQALKVIRSFSAAEKAFLKQFPSFLKSLKIFKGTALGAGRVLGATFAVLTTGFSIWSIVSTSKDLADGSKTKAGKDLRERADAMLKEKKRFQEIYDVMEF